MVLATSGMVGFVVMVGLASTATFMLEPQGNVPNEPPEPNLGDIFLFSPQDFEDLTALFRSNL